MFTKQFNNSVILNHGWIFNKMPRQSVKRLRYRTAIIIFYCIFEPNFKWFTTSIIIQRLIIKYKHNITKYCMKNKYSKMIKLNIMYAYKRTGFTWCTFRLISSFICIISLTVVKFKTILIRLNWFCLLCEQPIVRKQLYFTRILRPRRIHFKTSVKQQQNTSYKEVLFDFIQIIL